MKTIYKVALLLTLICYAPQVSHAQWVDIDPAAALDTDSCEYRLKQITEPTLQLEKYNYSREVLVGHTSGLRSLEFPISTIRVRSISQAGIMFARDAEEVRNTILPRDDAQFELTVMENRLATELVMYLRATYKDGNISRLFEIRTGPGRFNLQEKCN